jgi:hypothetical protein
MARLVEARHVARRLFDTSRTTGMIHIRTTLFAGLHCRATAIYDDGKHIQVAKESCIHRLEVFSTKGHIGDRQEMDTAACEPIPALLANALALVIESCGALRLEVTTVDYGFHYATPPGFRETNTKLAVQCRRAACFCDELGWRDDHDELRQNHEAVETAVGKFKMLEPVEVTWRVEALIHDLDDSLEQLIAFARYLIERLDVVKSKSDDCDSTLMTTEKKPSLTAEAEQILVYLTRMHPRLCTYDKIAAATHLSRATVWKGVTDLVEMRFAHRPAGPRKGVCATEAGRAVVAQFERKQCAD